MRNVFDVSSSRVQTGSPRRATASVASPEIPDQAGGKGILDGLRRQIDGDALPVGLLEDESPLGWIIHDAHAMQRLDHRKQILQADELAAFVVGWDE